ncbi:MAG: replication-associated recombination protein A [Acidobacteriota bacterium]
MNKNLFSQQEKPAKSSGLQKVPLAERMRPQRVEDVFGQESLLGEEGFLRQVISGDEIPSMILWGPPGVGKTTLAHVIAHHTRSHFVSLSAVLAGIKDVKRVVEEAKYQRRALGRRTILFVDEIHRFNKAQQDAFLPHVEKGTLTLIGATTENPSFEVISPLLSRSRVLVLKPLGDDQIVKILERALADRENGLGRESVQLADRVLEKIALFANGDARIALNSLEAAFQLARRRSPEKPQMTVKILEQALQKRATLYDKSGEEHYNLISALHKSLRNSDVDASLYWLARMLEAGEDPLYIARRMVRFASEDIGVADPQALGLAMDAREAVHFIGLPEGKLALAQLAVYLAQAPKSNAVYRAYAMAQKDVERTRNEPVPLHLRNAPTALMKEIGYGKGYRYAHDERNKVADMDCLPPQLAGRRYYHPTDEGFEKELGRRLREIRRRRLAKSVKSQEGGDAHDS